MASPTIITCAVTGSITSPAQHPGIPVTPEQIADAAAGARQILGLRQRDSAAA